MHSRGDAGGDHTHTHKTAVRRSNEREGTKREVRGVEISQPAPPSVRASAKSKPSLLERVGLTRPRPSSVSGSAARL